MVLDTSVSKEIEVHVGKHPHSTKLLRRNKCLADSRHATATGPHKFTPSWPGTEPVISFNS
jgi:hypothetical protein